MGPRFPRCAPARGTTTLESPLFRRALARQSTQSGPGALADRALARAPEPAVQAVEQEIDHGSRVEGQRLRHQEPADDGNPERAAQLRSRAAGDDERYGTQQRRQRRHQDRPEALETSLEDRLLGGEAAPALG